MFNPYMPPYYNIPQQNYFQQQPSQQSPQGIINTNKLFANGIEDVKSRMLPTNSDYIFLDNDKDLLYRKVTDGTGKQSIQTYKLVEYSEEEKPQQQTIDTSVFATKEDLGALKQDIESLKKAASALPSVQNLINRN